MNATTTPPGRDTGRGAGVSATGRWPVGPLRTGGGKTGCGVGGGWG